jgi:hypothetical protein
MIAEMGKKEIQMKMKRKGFRAWGKIYSSH